MPRRSDNKVQRNYISIMVHDQGHNVIQVECALKKNKSLHLIIAKVKNYASDLSSREQ